MEKHVHLINTAADDAPKLATDPEPCDDKCGLDYGSHCSPSDFCVVDFT